VTDQFRQATLRVLRVAFLSAFTLEFLSTISIALVAVEIGLRLLHGGIQFESAIFLLIIAPEFYLPLRALGAKFHAGQDGVAAAKRIFTVLETPPPKQDACLAPIPDRLALRFEEVSYSYENRTRSALNRISMTISPGEHVAIVGESGSGKSTMAHLLLRFIEPDAGRILVDETPLAAVDADYWRSQIAWVPQNPYLFNTTIAENIRLGDPHASLQAVVEAARAAEAHAFIEQLPNQYDTLCGERGLRLSGGQAQRIALARVFLKDAPLLILDEAMAFLDPDTEARIDDALDRLLKGKTTLMIAHRLNTVRRADRILVMDDGLIAESGTHAELLATGGTYRHLAEAFWGDAL
jgi:ATP-binding cassette subfamily C protein CydD